jgi:hypothetical protein
VVVVSLKLVFTFTQKLIKCLGEVNLDSAAFQPSPSSQAVRVRVRVRVPVAVFWQKGRGRECTSSLQPHLALQATKGIICQPNQTLQRQQAATHPSTQRGVLRTVPLGAGTKGSAPKKRLIGKLGFLGRKYCTALCCAMLYSTVLSCWPLVDVPIVYVPQPGWASLCSPRLPSPESPFADTRTP